MLFASDLDNTLIQSYKVAKCEDICVEVKDGQQLSFMPPDSFSLLKEIAARCIFVPITTRSLEQYRRVDLGINPQYALVAHGAVLLTDGQVDEQWLWETRSMFETKLPKLSDNGFIYDIRYVEEFFVFAKSEKPNQAVKHLQTMVDSSKFEVYAVHNKVYIFPNGLNKGVALQRLKKRLSSETVICAGDSVLDIPMLKMADKAIVPGTLKIYGKNTVILDERLFVRQMLQTVKDFLK